MPVSWLDIILVVIMLLSGFLAMVRGFTREVFSIFSWAVAAVAALYLTPKYWTLVESYFPSPGFAQIAFAAGVFIIFLIVVSLITLRISDTVLDSRVGALDRTLGLLVWTGARLPARRHRLYSVQRPCPGSAGMGEQRPLLPDPAADASRHRIAAADESRAISSG